MIYSLLSIHKRDTHSFDFTKVGPIWFRYYVIQQNTVFAVPDEGASLVRKFAQYIWHVLILLIQQNIVVNV
jgi:hypothetical protein